MDWQQTLRGTSFYVGWTRGMLVHNNSLSLKNMAPYTCGYFILSGVFGDCFSVLDGNLRVKKPSIDYNITEFSYWVMLVGVKLKEVDVCLYLKNFVISLARRLGNHFVTLFSCLMRS